MIGHLRHYAALFQGPRERLQQVLREAGTTQIWAEAGSGAGSVALEQARTLFEALPADQRDPGLVIGLLRLAHELGLREWLGAHAEPLLLTLQPSDVFRMRASDADILRPLVQDATLVSSFEMIQEVWRGPTAGGTADPN